jgi:hypothetical protein
MPMQLNHFLEVKKQQRLKTRLCSRIVTQDQSKLSEKISLHVKLKKKKKKKTWEMKVDEQSNRKKNM